MFCIQIFNGFGVLFGVVQLLFYVFYRNVIFRLDIDINEKGNFVKIVDFNFIYVEMLEKNSVLFKYEVNNGVF